MTAPTRPNRIVISGASRGIGAALARLYARPGASLVLLGRDRARLADTAASCRATGAAVEEALADIRDRDRMAALLDAADDAAPVDLVIANAGVALPTGDSRPGVDMTVYDEIDINVTGTLNTVLPLAPRMAARRRGQIAIISSLAALVPLPGSPGYGASKAALLSYGQAFRQRLGPTGVRVSVVCAGFVETDMGSRYQGWRPLQMSAEAAARRIRAGLAADRGVIAFPTTLAVLARASGFVPDRLRDAALRSFRFTIGKPG